MLLFTSGRIPWLSWNLTYVSLKQLVAFTGRWFTIICGLPVARFVGPHEKEPPGHCSSFGGTISSGITFATYTEETKKAWNDCQASPAAASFALRRLYRHPEGHLVKRRNRKAQCGEAAGNRQKRRRTVFTRRRTSWASIRPWSLSAVNRCNCEWINMPLSVIAPTVAVPDHLVGEFVDVSVRSRELRMLVQNKRVAVHGRSYEKHSWNVEDRALPGNAEEAGALAGSLALAGSHYLKGLYMDYFQKRTP